MEISSVVSRLRSTVDRGYLRDDDDDDDDNDDRDECLLLSLTWVLDNVVSWKTNCRMLGAKLSKLEFKISIYTDADIIEFF